MSGWATDDEVVGDLYEGLLRYASVVAGAGTDPEDLVHDALVATLRVHRLTELEHPMAYLRRAVLTAGLARERRSGTLGRVLALLRRDRREESTYPSDLADLDHLQPLDRALLFLVHVEGSSYAEAADVLGLSEVNARQRAGRARARLRTELQAEEL